MAKVQDSVMKEFLGLIDRLSPENLSCDGECSRSRVDARRRQIMQEWKSLERKVGRKVSIDEVEQEQVNHWNRIGSRLSKTAKQDEPNDKTNPVNRMAGELVVLAKEVLGFDFKTQDELDKYMKDHPGANRSNHRVLKRRTVWDDMSSQQRARALSLDRQDSAEKAKKNFK